MHGYLDCCCYEVCISAGLCLPFLPHGLRACALSLEIEYVIDPDHQRNTGPWHHVRHGQELQSRAGPPI